MHNLYRNTADFYDFDSRDNLKDDIPFYIEYAKERGGEVLELGCGTGRVACELAKADCKVTGLDLSEAMLGVFRGKLEGLGGFKDNITLVHSDMTDFKLDKKFNLIIAPFRAFQLLTDDGGVKNALACIREHLTEGGMFIINVFRPYKILDESWLFPETVQWETDDAATGAHIVKTHRGYNIDIKNQLIYVEFAYTVTDRTGRSSRHTEDLKLKYYYGEQLTELLLGAGFAIQERFGWYDKSPVEGNRELIFVCGRAE